MRQSRPLLICLVSALLLGLAVSQPCFSVVETSIADLQSALASGQVTCVNLVQAYLDRIAAYDTAGPELNAFIALNPLALSEAADLDNKPQSEWGQLHCIPYVAKDLYNAEGMPTTAGSLTLADSFPAGDSFIISRLRAEGALLMGKVNLAEFALGVPGGTNSSLGGQTLNSYNVDRSPQGSSGGTATAVAASFAAFGLGTDTNASILSPCNVQSLFGLRSTQGLISAEGVIPLFPLQDVPGPMCRTAEDLAKVMNVLDSGHTVLRPDIDYTTPKILNADSLKDIRIGFLNQTIANVPQDPFLQADANVIANSQATIEALRALNASVTVIPDVVLWELFYDVFNVPFATPCLDSLEYNSYDKFFATMTAPNAPIKSMEELIAAVETTEGEMDAVTSFFATLANPAIECPTQADASCAQYMEVRTELARFNEYALAHYDVDVLMFPPMNRESQYLYSDEEQVPALSWAFLSASSGMPAIVVPSGYSADGTPLGMTFMARNYQEPLLVSLAYSFNQLIDVRRPPPTTPDLCSA